MKTTYEFIGQTAYRADPGKDGDVTLTIKQDDNTVKTTMTSGDALALKRNLARLVDPGVADPFGYSIKELVLIRKKTNEGADLNPEDFHGILDAYIRLIEATVEGK